MIKMFKMSLSKKALSGRLQKKTLSLSKKVQLLDYRGKKTKMVCCNIAEIFKIGKTSAAKIIQMKRSLAKSMLVFKTTESKFVRGNFTNSMKQGICVTKCCAANLYPTGALIREVLQMKERVVEAVPELDGFLASIGWLESFKMSYGM